MTDKCLAMKIPPREIGTEELFNSLKNSPIFIENEDANYSLIMPYIILTDGKEIVVYENKDGEVELGIKCLIKKAQSAPKGSTNFVEDTIQAGVLRGLRLYFSEINTREGMDKPNKPNEPPGIELMLDSGDIGVHCTGHAITSLDRKYVIPIYFLIFPNNRLVKLKPYPDLPQFKTAYINAIVKSGLAKYKLSTIAKKILVLIGTGNLVLPIVSESDDITRI